MGTICDQVFSAITLQQLSCSGLHSCQNSMQILNTTLYMNKKNVCYYRTTGANKETPRMGTSECKIWLLEKFNASKNLPKTLIRLRRVYSDPTSDRPLTGSFSLSKKPNRLSKQCIDIWCRLAKNRSYNTSDTSG